MRGLQNILNPKIILNQETNPVPNYLFIASNTNPKRILALTSDKEFMNQIPIEFTKTPNHLFPMFIYHRVKKFKDDFIFDIGHYFYIKENYEDLMKLQGQALYDKLNIGIEETNK